MSLERLALDEYDDTREIRVIGQPVEVPLVEVNFENGQFQGSMLCRLINALPHEVDVLIGNDLHYLMPLQVSVVTRCVTNTQKHQGCRRPSH